jgi:hypothetical protein
MDDAQTHFDAAHHKLFMHNYLPVHLRRVREGANWIVSK